MIYDDYGFPKDNGANDYMDSARLNGICAIFEFWRHNGTKYPINCIRYIGYNSDAVVVAVRHPAEAPSNNWRNFTRDQLICLAAGLYKHGHTGTVNKLRMAAINRFYRAQNTEADVVGSVKKFPNGADLLTPSVMGHLKRCSGLKANWFQDTWLKMDIIYHGKFAALDEPNQILCMCIVAGHGYVQMYKKYNPRWKDGIRLYWCGWRNEPDLAEWMINFIDTY